MQIDWTYPWIWSPLNDTTSCYKSAWLGWWLIIYVTDHPTKPWWRTIEIAFQPGL